MRYLVIGNAGTLDRQLLELIGLSTKKGEDAGTIGHKGSGAKLAALAATRAGLQPAIASSDAQGDYCLHALARPLRVALRNGAVIDTHRLAYRYWALKDGQVEEIGVRETNLVACGFADWDQPIGDDGNPAFKIVRELVSNAYDEDPGFKIAVVDADKVKFAPPGRTAVYLRCTDAVRAIFKHHARYFKFFFGTRSHERVKGRGAVWPKSSPEETRLFVRGVLASCVADEKRRTLFDYDLTDRGLLSEERILKSEQDCQWQVGKLLLRLRRADVVQCILAALREGRAPYEAEALSLLMPEDFSRQEDAEFWLHAVYEEFGERIALRSAHDYINLEAEQLYRYKIVGQGNAPLERFLRLLGVPTADEIVPLNIMDRIEQIGIGDLSPEGWAMFSRANALFTKHLPDYARSFPVALFRAKRPDDEVVAQQAAFIIDRGFGKEVWIKVDERGSFPSVADIIRSRVHEPWHGVTGALDHDRRLVAQAECDVVMAIFRHEGEPFFEGTTPVRGWGDPDTPPFLVALPIQDETATRDTDPGGLAAEYEDGPITLDPNSPFIDVEENQD